MSRFGFRGAQFRRERGAIAAKFQLAIEARSIT